MKVTASDGHGGSVSDTFDIVVSAAAGVTVSTSALTVTEEDTTGNTYTVVLDTRPTANVTVTVAGHGGTDVTLSVGTLRGQQRDGAIQEESKPTAIRRS